MRAITYTAFGTAEDVLTLTDLPDPEPAAGEVRVRLKASGVNPSDVKVRAGGRPGVTAPAFPTIIPHSDGAGIIDAVGAGVDPARIGERVWVWNGQWNRAFGTAAELITLPAEQAVPLPDAVSFTHGATLGIPGITATHAVLGGGPVTGQTVLVSGGAGTVGHLAIQVAAQSGATVIATARGEEGMQAAKDAGADHVLDYTSPTLADDILAATNGTLIDRIVEVEFGQNIATNTAVIAAGGTIAAFGSAKMMEPTLPFYPLMFKAVTLDLVLVYILTPAQREAATDALTELLKKDALKIRIGAQFPLSECAKAHDRVADGTAPGSVILEI